jgi:lysyl-tRNA synthetase class 1
VFGIEPPFDVPYEFFLVGGQKMSSSKGKGSSAKEISDLVPAKILRLAILGKDINQAINFDPEGDTIPVLYDQYDKLAENFWTGVKDDYARLFEMIHIGHKVPAHSTLPRFSQVAFMVQMPHMDLAAEFPQADPTELAERADYAKRWLAQYAPEKFVFKLQETMPEVELTAAQKSALADVRALLESNPAAAAEDIHAKLHESKEFKGVYLAFLGKDHGPKAGWFLASLPRDFVLARLAEASQ